MRYNEVIAIIEEILEVSPGTVAGNENLVELEGWDSLKVVIFIAMIDEEFEITLSPQRIAESNTIDDLVSLVMNEVVA